MTSYVMYTGDGSNKRFGIPFPYIKRPDVLVQVNTITQYTPMQYTFVSDTEIEFVDAPAQNQAVVIRRVTDAGVALAQFHDGSILTEAELNLAVTQLLYLVQETRDYLDSTIGAGVTRLATTGGVGDGTAGSVIDAVVAEILNSQLLADLQQRITDIDTNAATIGDQVTRADGLAAQIADEVSRVDALIAGLGDGTFSLHETTERTEADTLINETIDLIGAKSADGLSFIVNMDTAKVSPTESMAQRFSGLQSSVDDAQATIASESTTRAQADAALSTRIDTVSSSVDDANAAITSEASTRASADTALSDQLTVVQSNVASNQAAITSEASTRADADSALGTRVDGILATANNNTSLILSEQTARADGDSANASSINTLQTKVDGNTASIQTQQTSLDGVLAEWTVKLDVNGYVSGIGLMNQGGSSDFIVLADRLALVTPGKTPTVPFAADANGVYMNDAYIRNLVVDKISGGAIKSTWNLIDTSGRIVLDTGAYMKVIGVGFGANSDLIEWFGPKMAVSACTKANGTTWVGMNGDAYFGGSLSAGTLYNAQQSTSVASNAQISIGPYATNGNAKTIVLSYTYSDYLQQTGSGNGSSATSATIDLYRTIGTGAETKVATLTASGTWTWTTESGTRRDDTNISGSLTFTDSVAGLDNRTYRAVLTSRTQGLAQTGNAAQRITLASTEQ